MMGGTGEADRKRHFSSISSPTAAAAKKHPFVPSSEDKKVIDRYFYFGFNSSRFSRVYAEFLIGFYWRLL